MSYILRNELYIRITFVEWLLYGISFYNIFLERFSFLFLKNVFENLQGFLWILSYRICYRIYWSGGSLHLHILWDFYIKVISFGVFLEWMLYGILWKIFLERFSFLFLKNVFENLQGLRSSQGGLHRRSSQGVFTGGLHKGVFTGGLHMRSSHEVLYNTYSEMSNILRNEFCYVLHFLNGCWIFWKGSRIYFWKMFLRTLKEF